MALNAFKCNYLTPLHFKGLMPHSTYCNMSFRTRVFPSNQLQWYWQQNSQ